MQGNQNFNSTLSNLDPNWFDRWRNPARTPGLLKREWFV
jgi:hypothetical protein